MIKVRETFDIVTEESAEVGFIDERGGSMNYTNRATGRKFIADEYGSVFELHDGAWWFFCKLNGRTLRTAVLDNLKL